MTVPKNTKIPGPLYDIKRHAFLSKKMGLLISVWQPVWLTFFYSFGTVTCLAVQPCIGIGMQQLGVRALLADLAVGNHHNPVGMFDGGQAVCNRWWCARASSLPRLPAPAAPISLSRCRGGFIQDEDGHPCKWRGQSPAAGAA